MLTVTPGHSLTVRDLLTHQERLVLEVQGSKVLNPRDCVLGRVVDFDGISLFCGMHPRPLGPMEADLVVRMGRRACGVRTRPASLKKLKDPDVQLELIDFWHLRVEEADMPQPFPELVNTDGDPLLVTTDHFRFAPSHRARVLEALQKLEGAREVIDDEGEAEVSFIKEGNARIKAWDNTLIGRALVGDDDLRLETNSMKRADALRARVEHGLGSLVKHRAREHADMESMMRSAAERGPVGDQVEPPPELKALAAEFKERHMLHWLDEEIPALGGLTPRAAARTPKTRAKLELLLRDMENHESRLPADERFDVSKLRTELGVSP